MLDIGQQQLLVLLLVIESELHKKFQILVDVIFESPQHSRVHMSPVFENLVNRWPRQETTSWSGMHLAGRIIIRVEQVVVLLGERRVPVSMRHEYEALEEPGDVGEMPLRRTDIRHALHDVVLDGQVVAQRQRCGSNPRVTFCESFRRGLQHGLG